MIAAIATAPGRGGVGIVRVSGGALSGFAEALTGRLPQPRHAGFVRFRAPDGEVIDEGILLYFPGPASFTGEDVLELHGHGGPVVMQLLLSRCVELGARLAEPGEFSRRAFVNGRIDLTQAEAVADLIEASTAAAARSAVRSLSGAFSGQIHALRDQLIDLRMLVEATLDFPDEEIDFLTQSRAFERLAELEQRLASVVASARQGCLLRDGIRVVLVGRPNVGKSSLLNALTGDQSAIVTDIAGTTRDVLRETIQVHGIPIHVVDTAGLREEVVDLIERIGIERTWSEVERADVVLRLLEVGRESSSEDAAIDERIAGSIPRLRVMNKIDLTGEAAARTMCGDVAQISVSARTGEGLSLLRDELAAMAGWCSESADVPLARERHVLALQRCQQHVEFAQQCATHLELLAEELRLAHESLGEITGEFTSDDLLGVIFSRFCIGK